MVKQIAVEGFDACMKAVDENKGSKVFVMFSGSKTEAGNMSWCPDCVVAEPVLAECLKVAPEDSVYIYCGVGTMEFWKDKSNVFRTDDRTKLKSVPTLIKWGESQRLEEAQCADSDLVKMLFEED